MTERVSQGCWLKLQEASQALGVSEITLRRRLKAGKLSYEMKDGRYYVYLDGFAPASSVPPAIPLPDVRSGAGGTTTLPRHPAATVAANAIFERVPYPEAQAAHVDARREIETLRRAMGQKDSIIQDLQRQIADLQTLIAFLEETLDARRRPDTPSSNYR